MDTPASKLIEDNASLQQRVAEQDAQLLHNQIRIEQLEHKLRLLQHDRFGRSSEQHTDNANLSLFNEAEWLVDNLDSDNEKSFVKGHSRRRKSFKDNLQGKPRVDVIHDLTDADKQCEHCGETMVDIGSDNSEQLALMPLVFYVLNHIRRKYACPTKCCIKTAPMPAQPLPGTHASPVLLAWLATSKYHDALPLYRLEKMAAREGVDLARNKMARWLIDLTQVLQPVYNLLQDTLFSYDIVMSDDTGIQVLKEDGRRADNRSYLWIRRGGPPGQPVVLVDYAPSRSGETAYGLLSQCHGYLVSDAADNFNKTVERNKLTQVLCNDHARRKFSEVIKGYKKSIKTDKKAKHNKTKSWIATKALDYYKLLYRIEKRIQNLPDVEKLDMRQSKASKVWGEFIQWATKIYNQGVTHDATREALGYLIKHEIGLRAYCEDGRLPISNIQAEHVAKTIALARKNFLFADTPAGAHASARLFSLLESAKVNGHNPFHYLTVLLTDLPNVHTVEDIEALLPWNLTAASATQQYQAMPTP